jgi:hypothetical protein
VNVPLNPIEHSLFCFALGAILRVNLRMSQIYGNLFERPSFSPGIHANGNRSAGSEGGEEQIIGRESCIRAACRHRFISSYSMTARDNFLSKPRGTTTNHYLTHVTPLRFSFAFLVRAASLLIRLGLLACISGGSINARNTAAHGTNVGAELAAMVHGIKQSDPQQASHGILQ